MNFYFLNNKAQNGVNIRPQKVLQDAAKTLQAPKVLTVKERLFLSNEGHTNSYSKKKTAKVIIQRCFVQV